MNTWDPVKIQHVPWYAALQPVFEKLDGLDGWPSLLDYQRLLELQPQSILTAHGKPLHVVAQNTDKTTDWQQSYEARIYLRGELQTRLESWHDCFNLLTWIVFPRAKAALNARQYDLLETRAGLPFATGTRSAAQDALTQFDESGVIVLCADPALSNLLLNFQWKRLFWENRAKVTSYMRCILFGHGLMDRAQTPYPGLTGKGMVLPVAPDFFKQPPGEQAAQTDQRLAQVLSNPLSLSQPKDLAPVPFLGFPGFVPENTAAAYYDDQRYFRPGRSLKP